jgi:multidrug efflux pump subunit AcrB
VNHYHLYPSAEINGHPAPGTSSGQAITSMDNLGGQYLPDTMGFESTELTLRQSLADKDLLTMLVFPLAVVFVFRVLSDQYDSWSLPFAILLIVPMCLLAAMARPWLSSRTNAIFTLMGLVALIGLAAMNAILYCAVCQAAPGPGQGPPRGHGGGLALMLAANPDDVSCAHPGRGPPGFGQGGWR